MISQNGGRVVGASDNDTFEELCQSVSYYWNILRSIEAQLPRSLWIARYQIKLDRVKTTLKREITGIINDLLAKFSDKFAALAQL